MSLFKCRNKNTVVTNSDNGVLGFKHLEDFTEVIENPEKLERFEWRRKLQSTTGSNKFKIKFYGELHESHKSLIVRTDFAPQKILAVDSKTNEEILIFDGCKHGYNALMCDTYSEEQRENRDLVNKYLDQNSNDVFELILSAYYQIDYDDEFREDVDEVGKIEILNGDKIEFDELKRMGCSYFRILGINMSGQRIEILSEELS